MKNLLTSLETMLNALRENAPFLAGLIILPASIFLTDVVYGLNTHKLIVTILNETALPTLNNALQTMGIDPLQLSPELNSALSITTVVLGSVVMACLTTAIYNGAIALVFTVI